MFLKKPAAGPEPRTVNFSCRLSETDAEKIRAIAASHDWPLAKTIQKLIVAALDAKMLR